MAPIEFLEESTAMKDQRMVEIEQNDQQTVIADRSHRSLRM